MKRLGKATVTIGLITAAALAAAAGPISYMRSFPRTRPPPSPRKLSSAGRRSQCRSSGRTRSARPCCSARAATAIWPARRSSTRSCRVLCHRGTAYGEAARDERLGVFCGFFVLRFAVSAGGAARAKPFPRTARAGCAIARYRRRRQRLAEG